MAEEKNPMEWPREANEASDFTFMMVGNNNDPIMKIKKEKLNEIIVVQGESMPAIQGGTTTGTAVALSAGPTGQNRWFDASWGYWKYNNVVLKNPLGTDGIPQGNDGTLYWDGTALTWKISKMQELPQAIADGIVSKGNIKAPPGGGVFESNMKITAKVGYSAGGSYDLIFERGSIDSAGVDIPYVSTQPRMRTGFISLKNTRINISSVANQVLIYVYDITKRFRYRTTDVGFINNYTINPDNGYFRIVAKKADDSIISDLDLQSDVVINTQELSLKSMNGLDKVESLMGTTSYNVFWTQGSIDDTDEQEIYKFKHALFSSFYKSIGNTLTVSVNVGYKVRVKIYKGPEGSKENIVSTHASAVSHTINLDGVYYVRLVVASDNNTDILLPSDIVNTGLTITGVTESYRDVRRLAKARRTEQIVVSYVNGYYNYTTRVFVPTADKKSVDHTAATNEYIYISVNPLFFINYSIWEKDANDNWKLVVTKTARPFVGINLYKNQNITVAVGKRDFTDYNGTEVIGLDFVKVDETKVTTGFMNLNAKLHKSNYNADEYGLRIDNYDNSPALQDLINAVFRSGGGRIILPVGTFDFRQRIIVKSNVDLVGYGADKTVLRMVGDAAFSLFDNQYYPLSNCKYLDFTVDGYGLNPANGIYTTDMKAFNFHEVLDCDFSGLTLQGTPATGLGIDYLVRVNITNNRVIKCGRLWMPTGEAIMQGGSGIGIGTGKSLYENFIVTNNLVEGCGQNGIFIEDQGLFGGPATQPSRCPLIADNIVINGRHNGLASRGNTLVQWSNNIVYNNKNAGFFADHYMRDQRVQGNSFIANKYGMYLMQQENSYDCEFTGNTIKGSTDTGIYFNGTLSKNFDFVNNKLTANNIGVDIRGNSDDAYFEGNKIRSSGANRDLIITGTHNDMVFKRNSIRGTVTKTGAVFTGNTSDNDLV